jgi:hypothetical protein
MPFNGSGVFTRVHDWSADRDAGINIDSGRADAEDDGFADGLSQCITRNGETTVSANIPLNGFKMTGVGSASARNHYMSGGDVQDGRFVWGGTPGGSANALTLTLAPALPAYTAGQTFRILPGVQNTGTVTINISGLGAKAIKKKSRAFGSLAGLVELSPGDIRALCLYEIVYDGTAFQLMTPTPEGYYGNCRLTYTNATTLTLVRKNGDRLCINGVNEQIPSAGVTLSNSGLLADTTYFIYAAMSGSTMILEASTTGHAEDSTTGMEIKSGVATRALVGMARVNSSGQFEHSALKIGVITYFNRRQKTIKAAFTADRTSTSTSYAEINSEIRLPFICWPDGDVFFAVRGAAANDTASAKTTTAVGIDTGGVTTVRGGSTSEQPNGSANQDLNAACSGFADEIEGFHYATIQGKVGSGTATWNGGSATAESDITLAITVWG